MRVTIPYLGRCLRLRCIAHGVAETCALMRDIRGAVIGGWCRRFRSPDLNISRDGAECGAHENENTASMIRRILLNSAAGIGRTARDGHHFRFLPSAKDKRIREQRSAEISCRDETGRTACPASLRPSPMLAEMRLGTCPPFLARPPVGAAPPNLSASSPACPWIQYIIYINSTTSSISHIVLCKSAASTHDRHRPHLHCHLKYTDPHHGH